MRAQSTKPMRVACKLHWALFFECTVFRMDNEMLSYKKLLRLISLMCGNCRHRCARLVSREQKRIGLFR